MNCIKDGKYTGDSCFGCTVKAKDCEIRDKVYRNRWIPVSERLPNKPGLHLVFNDMSIVKKIDIDDYHNEIEIMYFSLKHKKFNTNSIVKAWQSLPEPYKEEE